LRLELESSDIEKIAEQIIERLEEHLAPPVALLTPEELAIHLNVPLSWVYDRSRDNTIPLTKVGKYVRFSLSEVLAWLKTNHD